MRRAEQPPGQVRGDDAVAEGALPSGPGQHAAPRLQDQEHRGVSRAGNLRRCEPWNSLSLFKIGKLYVK